LTTIGNTSSLRSSSHFEEEVQVWERD
jgi:hypothetical protein